MKIESPFRFRERQLFVGGGGAGKTSAALSQIQASQLSADVIDLDYSQAWQRALDTEFTDAAEYVSVHVVQPEWEAYIVQLEEIVDRHGDDSERWLVIDSISPTWELCQSWYVEIAMGNDLGKHMAQLRRDSDSLKDYQGALAESMNWPAIKKAYGRTYKAIMAWKGHLILTAEAKSIRGERDADQIALYGQVGYKPSGEGRLHHVTSTTLFFQHAKKGFEYSTIKDRNRPEVEHKLIEPLDDGGFATSYLREVAGWQIARKKAAAS